MNKNLSKPRKQKQNHNQCGRCRRESTLPALVTTTLGLCTVNGLTQAKQLTRYRLRSPPCSWPAKSRVLKSGLSTTTKTLGQSDFTSTRASAPLPLSRVGLLSTEQRSDSGRSTAELRATERRYLLIWNALKMYASGIGNPKKHSLSRCLRITASRQNSTEFCRRAFGSTFRSTSGLLPPMCSATFTSGRIKTVFMCLGQGPERIQN
jgi:hypothetical protein